ncbi:hypothetical protein A5658_09890 [Mycobacterium sp. 1245111.1]|nr:hypothetical protein A5658_09890 [Mycobacterium sp. 1245111.1]
MVAGDFDADVESDFEVDESLEELDFSEDELAASPELEPSPFDDALEVLLLEPFDASRLSVR